MEERHAQGRGSPGGDERHGGGLNRRVLFRWRHGTEPRPVQHGRCRRAARSAGIGVAHLNQPFTLAFTSNDQLAKLELTAKSVTCGQGLDPGGVAYATSAGATSMPTLAPGTQYCVLYMTARNTGTSMLSWDASETVSLNVGAAQYQETSADQDLALDYEQYWHINKGQDGPTLGLNPGAQGPLHGVFEIPVCVKPTSVWVAARGAITTIQGVSPGLPRHAVVRRGLTPVRAPFPRHPDEGGWLPVTAGSATWSIERRPRGRPRLSAWGIRVSVLEGKGRR